MARFRLVGLRPAPHSEVAKKRSARSESRLTHTPNAETSQSAAKPASSPEAGGGENSRTPDRPLRASPEQPSGLELKGILELVGSIAAPVTVVTSVLFYFGWVYTGAFYGYFAIDRSALDLSVRDYVVGSINSIVWPLILGLMLGALWTLTHGLVMHSLYDARRRALVRRLSIVIAGLGILCLAAGLIAAWIGNPYESFLREVITPLGLAGGAALVGYAVHVHRQTQFSPMPSDVPNRLQLRWPGRVGLGLTIVLVAINLLWAITFLADAFGRTDAYQLAGEHFIDQPAVIIYSSERLFLDPFGGVPETTLGGKRAAYQFRYSGLRLLIRSGGKYFMVPDGYSTDDPIVIVLKDNDSIRVEFIRT